MNHDGATIISMSVSSDNHQHFVKWAVRRVVGAASNSGRYSDAFALSWCRVSLASAQSSPRKGGRFFFQRRRARVGGRGHRNRAATIRRASITSGIHCAGLRLRGSGPRSGLEPAAPLLVHTRDEPIMRGTIARATAPLTPAPCQYGPQSVPG